MTKGREKSDGRVVPQGRRKTVPTARSGRGGKAITASKQVGQLELFRATADSPQGAEAEEMAAEMVMAAYDSPTYPDSSTFDERRSGERVALLVDRFEGQQEIYVKPVPDLLASVRILAGLTVLEDGSPVFLIDLNHLV